jgi:hypothetical protein
MANKDVIRVFDTPGNLASNLKDGMFGFDQTGNRFAAKRLSDSIMKYVSEDGLQCLLAGNQTLTGIKTFTQNIITTADKLIGIDQVGGIQIRASNKIRVMDSGVLYGDVTDKQFNVLNGDQQILDFTDTDSTNIITNGTFASAADWTFDADMGFDTDHAEFTYSSGAGYIEQVAADFNAVLIYKQWYAVTYTIASASGALTGEITTDTAENAVSMTMTDGTHTVYFEATNSADFRMSFTGDAGSSFEIDTIICKTILGGNIMPFGGIGGRDITTAMYVSKDGNIAIADGGKIGAYPNIMDPKGLSFASDGNASLTHKLLLNQDSDTLGASGVDTVLDAQTDGAVSDTMDFSNIIGSASSAFSMMIMVTAQNTAEDKGYGKLIFYSVRANGAGTETEVGETALATQNEFGAITAVVSVAANKVRITVTGEAGEVINWGATIVWLRSTP